MPSSSPQSYIHGSSQAQFVAESHIILLLSILYVERKCFIMRFIQVGGYWSCRHSGFRGKPFFPPFVLSLVSRHDTISSLVPLSEWKLTSNGPKDKNKSGDSLEEREIQAVFYSLQQWKPAPLLLGYVPLPKVLQTSEHFSRRKWSRTEHPNILI